MRVIQIDLNNDYSYVLSEAIAILRQGGTIVYPTDTVYGLGCNATDEFAVRHIYDIKQRSPKPLPVLAKNMAWVEELVYLNDNQRKLASKFWPGKFTLIFPKKDIIPAIVTTGLPSVGIRIADYPFTDKLLGAFGYPLVATSANLSGGEATGDINKVIKAFAHLPRRPDLVIDAGVLPPSNPSVLIDCTTEKPKVLRVGPSKPEELLKLLDL
ncbi:MAG: threonylcarbamoyl-AMP synthase [Candidatus Yanofskybacteria bacterium RIFCSPLOWO2_01_FULL_49_17]|uniref:L-threonylcarbamoyladenylate synthase n=1 Tax=Candidatus Yanofskybacteria bacterium RIFCSPLOWO2_01_FULL_49_17 TaxID=1802700 RepID=A0A1F8GPK2_9BACT|nr:MAG: threonylcarbamoyl-AMP synthase [Candidatus Yanofskybacteria bacterium RIFCSPLOWO2_01_FULL_49_17]